MVKKLWIYEEVAVSNRMQSEDLEQVNFLCNRKESLYRESASVRNSGTAGLGESLEWRKILCSLDSEQLWNVNAREFRVQETWLAAILVCGTIHGTRCAPQETFLKIYLIPKDHPHHSLRIQGIWNNLLANSPVTRTYHEKGRQIATTTAEFNSTTPHITRDHVTWNPWYHLGDTSRNCTTELHFGKVPDSPDFRRQRVYIWRPKMIDSKIASASRKIIFSTSFKKRPSVEEQRAQKSNRFFRSRQIA